MKLSRRRFLKYAGLTVAPLLGISFSGCSQKQSYEERDKRKKRGFLEEPWKPSKKWAEEGYFLAEETVEETQAIHPETAVLALLGCTLSSDPFLVVVNHPDYTDEEIRSRKKFFRDWTPYWDELALYKSKERGYRPLTHDEMSGIFYYFITREAILYGTILAHLDDEEKRRKLCEALRDKGWYKCSELEKFYRKVLSDTPLEVYISIYEPTFNPSHGGKTQMLKKPSESLKEKWNDFHEKELRRFNNSILYVLKNQSATYDELLKYYTGYDPSEGLYFFKRFTEDTIKVVEKKNL